METIPFEIHENDDLVIEEMGPDGVPLGYMNPVLQLESDESSDEEDADNDERPEGNAPDEQEDMSQVFIGAASNSQSAPKSKFLVALMRASQLYSSRLRVPSAPSSFSALPVPQPGLPTSGQPLLSDMVESDADDDGVFSSEDEYSDDELLGDRPTLDADQAARLFYHPAGPWAKFANAPIENSVVISKLNAGAMCEAYIKRGTIQGREITYISKTWLLCQEWEGFFSEMALYSHPSYLQPLQGSVIPIIIGVYLVDGAISVAMELPSSSFWIEASDDMSDHLKRKCIAAFDMIHDCGVLHNDVELRHMLISAEGDVTIIDFQGSHALKAIKDVGLEAATEADIRLEKRKVMFKLNYGNARIKENEKRKRVFEREARNTRKRRRRVQAAAQAGGSGSIISLRDDESDAEDPDDVLNPIVEPQIWFDCWVGEDFEPICYVVPGQVESEVTKALQEFALKEFERQQKGKAAEFTGSVLADPRSTGLSYTAGYPRLSHSSGSPELPLRTSEDKGALNRTSEHVLPSPKIGLQLAPVLPTRVKFKRSRDQSEDDFSDDDTLKDSPPWKKYHVTPVSGSSRFIGNTLTLLADDPPNTSSPLPNSLASTPTVVPFSPIISPLNILHATNALLEKIPADIQVPYDGYAGAGGFTIPNTFSPKEIAGLRRTWIMQDNVQRCKEEGLPYPLAQRFGLTPSTERQAYDYGRNGKKKKKRLTTNRGALKRAQMEMEEPGRRKRDAMARKAEYFKKREREFDTNSGDSLAGNYNIQVEEGDGVEGPEILTWVEFFDYETSQRTDARPTSPPRNSQDTTTPSTQRRGILRRQLNPSEKARQHAYNEWMKKHRPRDSDDDEGDERPSKRSRIATTSSSESPLPASISASGFLKYTSTPNAFNVRSNSAIGSTSELRSLPSVPNASTAAVPSSLHSIFRSCASPSIMSSFAAHASVAKRRRSLDVSDSDSSVEDECVGLPKVCVPKKNSRSTRPMRLDDVNFDPRRSFGAWIPPSERRPSFHPASVSEDDRNEMNAVENMIKVDAGGAGRLLSIVSSIFKRSWS